MRGLNWAHLLLLAALPPYAIWTRGWPPGQTLAVATLAALVWLMAWERWRPLRRDWQPSRAELAEDARSLGLNALVDALADLALNASLLALLAGRAPAAWWSALPAWLGLPLLIVMGELAPFALHRWAHRSALGWRFHGLHHRPQTLNAANSVLVHPLNLLWNKLARSLVWALLAAPAPWLLWAALFMQIQSLAVHANVRGRMGWLNYLIGTAELHRWHHSVRLDEAHNYGTAVPLWDQLFGSFVYRPGAQPERLGWSLAEADQPDLQPLTPAAATVRPCCLRGL